MDKSGNPALKSSTLQKLAALPGTTTATVSGTVQKTLLLFAVLGVGAYFGWQVASNLGGSAGLIILGAAITAFVLGLLTAFVPKISPFTSPIYALAEGVLLGAISQFFNQSYPGIAIQALALTGTIFVSTLYLYTSRLVKVTAKFRAVVLIATVGIALYYVIALIAGLFGAHMPLIYDSGTFGIIFSVFVVFIASLNLLLDFDFVEKTAENNAPKVFEWYGAFSLMVTLVWLYLEILRLLGKTRN